MLTESNRPGNAADAPKLRAACENCRQSKVKCNLSGKNTCIRCLRHGLHCRYRVANRSGKPKGSKNRATLRKLGQLQEEKLGVDDLDKAFPAIGSAGYLEDNHQHHHHRWSRPGEQQQQQPQPSSSSPDRRGSSSSSILQAPTYDASSHSESPDSHEATMLLTSPVEYGSPFGDGLPPSGRVEEGLCGPTTSMSPTFLQKELITKGLTSCPLAVHVPSVPTFPPACDCDEALQMQMAHLRHMAVDTAQLRFDRSLQALRAALVVCQGFLGCGQCHKDSAKLLLAVLTLDVAAHLFIYWVSFEYGASPEAMGGGGGGGGDDGSVVSYGEYETSPDETRRVRRVLLCGRLAQCQEALGQAKDAVEMGMRTGGMEVGEGSWLLQTKMSQRLNQISSHLNFPSGLLANQVAIITGAGQGIGAETARLFANEGAKVIVADIDGDKANAVASAINSASPNRALAVAGDVLNDAYIAELVKKAAEFGGGKIHIIVNNAGFTWDGVIHKMTDKQWDTMLAVHGTAPFKLVRAAAPYFRVKDKEPRVIINISSTSGIHGNAGQANYALAKAGVVGLTRTIAKEWGPAFGVRSNTIAFGFVQTRLTAAKEAGAFITTPDGTKVALGIPGKQLDSRRGGQQQQQQEEVKTPAYPDIPLGRPASPEEAARAVLGVASPLFSYVSGETIRVTGGRNM
ncbi:hypothetical protein BDW42DRAFT_201429 [Aspergillus taichungensis]|uniref:Zn(2)-C6 fungal-type domain-containing protein n=1 Tax=Aspergillus taichungensis TaxID=482145 RepID=A0A2J5HRD2_9EURO|nr:hypothetical protein BDW42DRAFT_201429 [Aspergillus taichungensis]